MRDTRAAITEKLGVLEERVTERIEDIQHRVESTVGTIQDSVHDTVQRVKQTVDWRHQMNEHPWAMFGGAVLTGFVASRLMVSQEARSIIRKGMSAASEGLHQEVPGSNRIGEREAPSILSRAMDQFNSQITRLEHAAISAAGEIVERAIANAVPGLAGHLRQFGGPRVSK
jgi:ElaB/YqjD/DUF883 family membrane-anchored ribosome-binding protein